MRTRPHLLHWLIRPKDGRVHMCVAFPAAAATADKSLCCIERATAIYFLYISQSKRRARPRQENNGERNGGANKTLNLLQRSRRQECASRSMACSRTQGEEAETRQVFAPLGKSSHPTDRPTTTARIPCMQTAFKPHSSLRRRGY